MLGVAVCDGFAMHTQLPGSDPSSASQLSGRRKQVMDGSLAGSSHRT